MNKPKKLVTVAKETFESEYLKLKGIDYYWTAKDAKNASQLITKLRKYAIDKGSELDEENLKLSIKWMMQKCDPWIKDNMEMALLNSKYNQIISRNGQTTKAKELTNQEIHNIAGEMVRNKYTNRGE